MRLIDADKLCDDLLNRWSIADTKKEELIRQVMADIVTPIVVSQPTVNQWIPVSERLPEIKEGHESDDVLCFTDMEAYAFSRLQENIFGQCGFECEREDGYYTSVGEVIAWMPFPEPYKGDVTDSQDESTPVYLSDLYLCDPDKNTECKKTACYRNGGECIHTVHEKYRRVE